MIVLEETFLHFCSNAQNPIGYGVFGQMQAQIIKAQGILASVIGYDLFDRLPAFDELGDPAVAHCKHAYFAYAFVCFSAMHDAIAQLDITLSEAGFAVVRNENLAPASADRVERLRRQMKRSADDAFDDMINALRGNPLFCEQATAKRLFSTFIWRGSLLRGFGIDEPCRSDIEQFRSKISSAEIALKNLISGDFYDELAMGTLMDTADEFQNRALSCARMLIAALSVGSQQDAAMAKMFLLKYLDDNIAHFATYRNSSAYVANHFKPYENKKEDTCFFFG